MNVILIAAAFALFLAMPVAAQSPTNVSGTWRLNGNGFTGDLVISQATDGTLSGTMYGEPITGYHAALARRFVILRGAANNPHQAYIGLVRETGLEMIGIFHAIDPARGGATSARDEFNFIARRNTSAYPPYPGTPAARPAGPTSVAGRYTINGNGHIGTLALSQTSNDLLSGTMYDNPVAGFYANGSGTVTLLRASGGRPIQFFHGVASSTTGGNRLEGSFYPLTPAAGATPSQIRFNWRADPAPASLPPQEWTGEWGSPSKGGYMLFASGGSWEVWETDHYAKFVRRVDAGLVQNVQFAGIAMSSLGGGALSILAQQGTDGKLVMFNGLPNSVTRRELTRQPLTGMRARSLALKLGNPRECVRQSSLAEYYVLLERPSSGNLQDEIWVVREDGLVRLQVPFVRPDTWQPVAVGSGALENPNPWILFRRPDGREARLVLTSNFESLPEVQFTGTTVSFVSPTTLIANRPAADGYLFATTILDGRHPHWWHIYRWNIPDPDLWLMNPVAVQTPEPPDHRRAVQRAAVPANLAFVGYADRRPLCPGV